MIPLTLFIETNYVNLHRTRQMAVLDLPKLVDLVLQDFDPGPNLSKMWLRSSTRGDHAKDVFLRGVWGVR